MDISNQRIIFGRGTYRYYIELPRLPKIGQALNLDGACRFFDPGRFLVTAISNFEWRGKFYPRILLERVGDVPAEAKTIAVMPLEP